MLSLEVFKYPVELFQIPDIDMLASRLNQHPPKYASWMPDPESYITDCMSKTWKNTYIFAFSSFSMIWTIKNKTKNETENALIMWPTQTSFTWTLELATATPIIIKSWDLHLPGTSQQHSLCLKLQLLLTPKTNINKSSFGNSSHNHLCNLGTTN